jgi:hypothetical protein
VPWIIPFSVLDQYLITVLSDLLIYGQGLLARSSYWYFSDSHWGIFTRRDGKAKMDLARIGVVHVSKRFPGRVRCDWHPNMREPRMTAVP